MIISAVASLIYTLLDLLFVFELPQFPEGIINIFNSIVGYLGTGVDVLHALLGNTAMSVIGTCLKFVILANVCYFTISVIYFVLKKIPFLGLSG